MATRWKNRVVALIAELGRFFCWIWRMRWRLVLAAVAVLVLVAAGLYYDYSRDEAEAFFDDPVKQLKYGSTGGDRLAGIPAGIFKALPELCRDYLPEASWTALGFIYEDGMDRPIGTSKRRSLGFDRISLNCGACHVGTYRASPADRATIVTGMPAHRMDLGRFTQFLTKCTRDERFNPWQVIQAAERTGERYSRLDRILLRYLAVPAMREGSSLAAFRFRFLDHEVEPGPGRFDTFNSAKALLNWRFERLPERERVGIVDFPSLWLQDPRARTRMELHWDGNNVDVDERNRSAAFGTGAVPVWLDRDSLEFIAGWLRTKDNVPPRYVDRIEPVDPARAARGKVSYNRYCAECHGASGRDFSGVLVGKVDDIKDVRTDPCRLDNYTYELAAEQGNLYAGFPKDRFRHFRKTNGYANMPLDGLWLRGPYLHNGSVPTVRDLLEPWENRPPVFYRGYDLVDRKKLGFVSDIAEAGGVKFFRYETRCVGDPAICRSRKNPENRHDGNVCVAGDWAGNSNRGHDGPRYGTHLSSDEKDDLVEYLKTF